MFEGPARRYSAFFLSAVTLLLYLISVPLLFPVLGGGVAGFILIPLMVISWFAGMKRGLIIGVTGGILFNSIVLAWLYRQWVPDVLVHHNGLPGALMVVGICTAVGYFSELHHRYIDEIAKRKLAQNELEHKNEEIVNLTNAISHDLRNPLTGIRGILEVQKIDCEQNGGDATMIHLAMKESEYMQRLLDDLLEVARLDSGNREFEWKTVSLEVLFKRVIDLLHPQIAASGAQVHQTAEGISACIDEHAFEKVLMNLLGNALDYLGDQKHPLISLIARIQGSQVEILITDNGIGIPFEAQSTVFEKFKRGPNIGSVKGSGLGLAIVKGIVEAHHGTLRVESIPGKGSTFIIALPKKTVNSS